MEELLCFECSDGAQPILCRVNVVARANLDTVTAVELCLYRAETTVKAGIMCVAPDVTMDFEAKSSAVAFFGRMIP